YIPCHKFEENMRLIYKLNLLLFILLSGMISINAQNKEITLNFAGLGKLDMAAFKLSAETKIKISGSGAYLQGIEDSFEDEDGNYRRINKNTDILVFDLIFNS